MQLLPHDTVEDILERVPVKSLLRFKSACKQWKLTIESQYFQAKQLICSAGGKDLNLVLVSEVPSTLVLPHHVTADSPPLKTNVLLISSERYHIYQLFHNSCDGLVCLFDYQTLNNIVYNPATRWHRRFPVSSTNTWRYINPSSPYRINTSSSRGHALYVDGSLYWLTGKKEIKVLALDLHTETFQVISKAPFAEADHRNIITRSLNNRLCLSVSKPLQQMIIWSFNSENKTWEQIYSIVNRSVTQSLPVAILEKNKLLCCPRSNSRQLMIYDIKTKSVDSVSIGTYRCGDSVFCYFESLISIL
ncbi:F-box and associated interaction domains-containing protein [Arabidopsis thaliana]|uniref:F-box and associated interaction domains-containing protein n=1 Tax=Arabidopsis thaliana TaxID=3702 RepID=F4HUI9_ARATH|nr:F-box and associated interaction domains-containing protein [Arabidopsis thaliana]AEE29144.1 F-box and associated interaction domains-containing protein [Arabidopsis thaliana]|eukprot:NP_001154336.1 F-box and associated interaction domains-containing protein [Arabidopsis thaliana]